MHLVVAPRPVDRWLRVDRQEAIVIHLRQLRCDNARLGCRRLIGPRERSEFFGAEAAEKPSDLSECSGLAPQLDALLFLQNDV